MRSVMQLAFFVSSCLFLSGCGVAVPRIGEYWDADYPGDAARMPDAIMPITASGQIEFEVKKSIYCSLREAVAATDKYFNKTTTPTSSKMRKLLPDEWGAQVALSLEVDESTALSPGAAFTTPFRNAVTNAVGNMGVTTAQNRSIGLGATLSSTASRTDKFNSYYTIGYLRSDMAVRGICEHENLDPFIATAHIQPAKSSLLIGDLGVRDWLLDSAFVNWSIPSFAPVLPDADISTKARKTNKVPEGVLGSQDAVSIEIKFVVVTNGNINPVWKLVRITSNNGSSPFLAEGRTRTHDLIITVGPRNTQTDYANLALQIGQAVSGGNRAALANP